MTIVYESTFVAVGTSACESLADDFLITFGEGAPEDIAEYCFIHRNDINQGGLLGAGSMLTIGEPALSGDRSRRGCKGKLARPGSYHRSF